MIKLNWEAKLGIILVLSTLVIYSVKFLFLKNPGDTVNYIFNSLGFLPINVLLVTLVINRLLSMRAQAEKIRKMNMVVGTFFSEAGNGLLSFFIRSDPACGCFSSVLGVSADWDARKFSGARKECGVMEYSTLISREEIERLKVFLGEKRDFLLRLLENPVLLENESFTELLRAVFHLAEELGYRDDFSELPESDIDHLRGDINRVYERLVSGWIDYMEYLHDNFPYLYSLQTRVNPFDGASSAVVRL